MKVSINADEWYPVWDFDEDGQCEIDLTPEEFARIKAAFDEFEVCQKILGDRVPSK